jgi:hypothetical protein
MTVFGKEILATPIFLHSAFFPPLESATILWAGTEQTKQTNFMV